MAGVFIGFLVPKMLSIHGYGLYRTFILYMNYVGFCSLGIIDGIVLKFGGLDYNDLDRPRFRSYFRWYLFVHAVFVFVLFAASFLTNSPDIKFIICMLAINMPMVNYTGYFQQISQITQRFKEFSLRNVLQNVFSIVIVSVLYLFYRSGYEIDYRLYILILVGTNLILTVWYIATYKDINFGSFIPMRNTRSEVLELMKSGFPLLFANLISTLILNLDRQFVNFLFDTKTYAIYSFAYNMLSIVTVATSAFSVILYPTLKRTTFENLKGNYDTLIRIVLILVNFALVVYFPLCLFVQWLLPEYSASLEIFRIVFPGLSVSSAVTVVMYNYYKVLKKNIVYFKRSIIILFFSGIANMIAYKLFGTTASISIASIIVMITWYIYMESYFVKIYNYSRTKNLFYIVLMILMFYISTQSSSVISGAALYMLLFIAITSAFFKNDISGIKEIIQK